MSFSSPFKNSLFPRGMEVALRILCVLPVCLVLQGCGFFIRGPVEPLRDIMPRETDVPGWEIHSPHRFYTGEDIKSQGNELSNSGVRSYITGTYSPISGKSTDLHVTVYRFSSPLESFGLFTVDRGFGSMEEQIERGFYLRGNSAFFIKGEFYIRLVSDNSDDSLVNEIAVFRRVIEANIALYSTSDGLPGEAFFMAENDLLLDLVYYSMGYPLLEELGPLYVRRRSGGGMETRIFYTRKKSREDAEKARAVLLRSPGRGFIVSKTGGLLYAFRESREGGITAVARHKEWIFGAIDAENKIRAENILQQVLSEIRRSAQPGNG